MQLGFPDRKCVLPDCPHTCFNRNYPFRTGTYPFSQKILPRFSIIFIFNPFPPLVSSLPIT
ncbi:hypothetical protein BWP07_18880 [Bacteroides fragilis]|nr:hypothetical protein BWP07_18880 [Bacteroides fragilis]